MAHPAKLPTLFRQCAAVRTCERSTRKPVQPVANLDNEVTMNELADSTAGIMMGTTLGYWKSGHASFPFTILDCKKRRLQVAASSALQVATMSVVVVASAGSVVDVDVVLVLGGAIPSDEATRPLNTFFLVCATVLLVLRAGGGRCTTADGTWPRQR